MRAFWMIVVVAMLSTACSMSGESNGTARADTADAGAIETPAPGDGDDDETAGGRTLGEPAGVPEGVTETDDPVDTGALAFEEPLSEETSGVDSENGPDVDNGTDADNDTGDVVVESTELSRVVDQLIAFVERERGHTFTSRPGVTLLDGAEFTSAWSQLVAQDAVENATDYTNFTDIYRAMGVIDGSASLEEIWMQFGDAGVLGYYDPDAGHIVLRSGDITAFTKTVLVHELVHALDDQVFGLDRDEHADRNDEIDWTFSALIEGSAGVIEARYRATLSQAERDEEIRVQREVPRTVSLADFTTSFLELQFGRYRYGDEFAAALWNENGQAAIDASFVEPPSTSEVVIDPAAHFAGEAADEVDPPPADGEVFESGVWGEAGWAALFADVFGTSEALDLANGWGGDQYVAWRSGGETCLRAHITGDSPDVLDDYAFALEEWSTLGAGRDVFYPTADLVRVTACA